MPDSRRPVLPIAAVFATFTLVVGGSAVLADRIDRGGFIELTGDDRPAIPSLAEYLCFEAGVGVLYTKSAEHAGALVLALDQAGEKFEQRFGTRPKPAAVVDASVIPSATGSEIRAAGFDSFIPLSYSSPATGGLVMPRDRALSAMMHELGHEMFVSTIWGREARDAGAGSEGAEVDRPRTRRMHYGGGAPDWLDEIAAMLVQGDDAADGHRDNFARAIQDPERRDAALDLPRLFISPHPVMNNERLQRSIEEIREKIARGEIEGGSRMIMLSPEEAGAAERSPFEALYYPICLVFMDYMLETANDPAVFRRIADALNAGATLDEFLREHGGALGLPADEAALVDAWRDWALVQHDAT